MEYAHVHIVIANVSHLIKDVVNTESTPSFRFYHSSDCYCLAVVIMNHENFTHSHSVANDVLLFQSGHPLSCDGIYNIVHT